MKTVWKYPLYSNESVDPILEIPGGGKFLYLKARERIDRYGQIVIDTWWAVNTEAPLVEVQLHIRGTGLEVPSNANYLGTSLPIPGLVLHIFEKDRVFEELEIVNGVFVPKSQ